jgi:hypothetical protein
VVPPVKPPEPKPLEEFGPYNLKIGVSSDRFTMLADSAVLFRFRPKSHRVFVATTAGDVATVMALLDKGRNVIELDGMHSGKGPNALIATSLRPGTYYLKVWGLTADSIGPFRVKVMSVS